MSTYHIGNQGVGIGLDEFTLVANHRLQDVKGLLRDLHIRAKTGIIIALL